MARVIRLPDGKVFRSEPLVKDPTKLGMGNKGAFDFSETVKLLDQVAESKGIGALANVAEKAYDAIRGDVKRPGEEEKQGQIKKEGPADALTQAAMARVNKGTTAPRQEQATPEPRFASPAPKGEMLLRSDEAPQLVRAEPTSAEKAVAELDAAGQAMGEQAEREARIRENNRLIQEAAAKRLAAKGGIEVQRKYTPVPPRVPAQPVMPVEELPTQQISAEQAPPAYQAPLTSTLPGGRQERRLVQNTKEAVTAGGPPVVYADELERSPAGVFPQVAPGPAEAAPPQPPPPQMTVPVPTQPPPGMIGGGAPLTQKTLEKEATAAAQQVAANVGQEALRTEPVKAAEIDMAQFAAKSDKARNTIGFYSELADYLKNQGYDNQTGQPPVEIPYTVSIDELYGYAKNATTLENQKRVLDALANNRVTGMGFSTLADRLSGAYRQRYLTNVVSMFPKAAGKPNLIDAIGDISKAYSAEQLGRLRAADIAAGKPEAGVTKTLAQAGQAAAGAQLAAEKAVTERELRTNRAQLIAAQTSGKIIDSALKKAKAARGGGRGRKPLIKPAIDNVEKTFESEQKAAEARLDKLEDIERNLKQKAGQAKPGETVSAKERVLSPQASAAKEKRIAEADAARAQLEDIRNSIEFQKELLGNLAKQRGAWTAFATRTFLRNQEPTEEELKAFGLTQEQVLEARQQVQAERGYQQSRRRNPNTIPQGKGAAPAPAAPAQPAQPQKKSINFN